jgi:hypothetical protein
VKKGAQFQEAEKKEAKPEIHQSPEVKIVRVMLGGWRQVGIEVKVQALPEQDGNQVFQPFHRYGFHPRLPASVSATELAYPFRRRTSLRL